MEKDEFLKIGIKREHDLGLIISIAVQFVFLLSFYAKTNIVTNKKHKPIL